MTFEEWWGTYSRNDFRRSDEIAREAWAESAKSHQLLIDAARKIVRVHGNGKPKQLDDAVLLLRVAMAEYDKAPNAELRGAKPIGGASRSNDVLGADAPEMN